MNFKKDKRTKNLTLRDIHVGDWVQVWSEQTERYSPPLKIISIHDDGTIYLVTSDEERCTPWEDDIKNVDALPITNELLKGFGFDIVKKDCLERESEVFYKRESEVFYKGYYICEFKEYFHGCELKCMYNYYEYFHKFLDDMCDYYQELLNLQWEGVEK